MYSGTKIAKASYLRPYTREDSPLTEGKELALSPRFLSSSGGRSRPLVVVFPYPGT